VFAVATEKEANKAREAHSKFLRESGAHGILVDKVKPSRGENESFLKRSLSPPGGSVTEGEP